MEQFPELIADIERFAGRFSIGRDDGEGSSHFVRIKVPGGILTSEQFRSIANLASKYSRGVAEITDRQDIQLHWIRPEDSIEIFSKMDKMGFTTDMCGQGFPGARYGDVRNIVCCPASGIEKDEIYNCYPVAKELTSFFSGNPEYLDLPRKFKIAMTGCGSDCVRAEINDLAFVAVKHGDESGFTILVGGGIGTSLPGPRLARPSGVFIKPEGVFKVVIAAVEIFRNYGNRESKAKARFKCLIENWGVEKFISLLQSRVDVEFKRYNGPIFTRKTDHEGVQPQGNDGYYYVNIPILSGRLASSTMAEIADLADRYGGGELRLTPAQNIIIPNVHEENRESLLKAIMKLGFLMNSSVARWLSIGCASDFCGKTLNPHAKDVIKEIVDYLERFFGVEVLGDLKLRINASGCPNDCGASLIADIGLVGKQIREGNEIKQSYNIYVGGNIGNSPSLAMLVVEKAPTEKLKYIIASFIANYLGRRKEGEEIGEFCRRHTRDELKAFFMKPEGRGVE